MDLPLIISASKLDETIQNNSEQLLILDVRDKEAYLDQHIPSARWFNKQAVNKSDGKVSGLLPNVQDINDALLQSTYNNQTHIVIYNDNCNPVAGRVAWTLYAFGLKNISLLDGGFNYWQQEKLPTDQTSDEQEKSVSNSGFVIQQLQQPDTQVACNYQDILQALNESNTVIVDARTPAEYAGEDMRSTYGGHIPGAVNINWTETKDSDGLRFKPEAELHALFTKYGIHKGSHIMTYCQSHQRSALLAMLFMHLGYSYTTGYPGAWSDWGNREDTPKEK